MKTVSSRGRTGTRRFCLCMDATAPVRSPSAMARLILLLFGLLGSAAAAIGQTAEDSSLKGQPMEITSSGGTTYENGVASARENVAIHIGDTDLYADFARYDMESKVVTLEGNVRIYRGAELYVGDRGTYNTETKELTAHKIRSVDFPYLVSGERVSTISDNARLVQTGSFTTHDSATPDFQVRATTVRVYEGDRVILRNVTFYVGRVPIFYWPYMYQSLDDSFAFVLSPAYVSSWGPSVLGRITFPITDDIKGTLRLDYRGRRGAAIGFDADMKYGVKKSSHARLRTYFLQDQNPTLNRTSLPRGSIPKSRYRVGIENRTNLGKDWTGLINSTLLSDRFVLQDFFPAESRVNPQPDNIAILKRRHPGYSLTAFARYQLNDFHEVTERLPEIALDITRQPLFGTPIFYEGEASVSNLRRNFPAGSFLQDYEAYRADAFHQFLHQHTYFGWLSVVPRIGFRSTYYSETRDLERTFFRPNPDPHIPDFLLPSPTLAQPLQRGGDRFRYVANAGAEASFKISRTWEQAQSRAVGLDGLRHIAQPFVNFSYVEGDETNPAEILQFDRYQPSTRLRPIDFPQFTSIDSIEDWTIGRVGLRNRLQTRRDDETVNWMELETFFDVNFDNPYEQAGFSNIYNNFRFNPVPWLSMGLYSQLPLLAEGFTEINTDVRIQPFPSLAMSFGHRFLNENPFFANSSLYFFGAFYRLNDHWSVGGGGRYEAISGFVEEQRYTVYRDLSSWIASLGAVIRNNGGIKEYGLILTFTLKALPKFGFDFNYDPGAAQGETHNGIVPLP